MRFKHLLCFITLFFSFSCLDKDLYKEKVVEPGITDPDSDEIKNNYLSYLYPFGNEIENAIAELTIETDGSVDLSTVELEIPYLKYNKSWLFLFSQDDCQHAAYSRTWAAINGKPVSGTMLMADNTERNLYYNAAQLAANDIPPGSYLLNKTLGCTDGAGNEVRFHITTTLSPEWDWMHDKVVVNKGFTGDYNRFSMKAGLVWDNVREMLNYSTGIAFHDVLTEAVNNPDSIYKHFIISQDSILKNLNGRGCKMLAEPNGNKTYVEAAKKYTSIQTMTAQGGAVKLIPFQRNENLSDLLIERLFVEPEELMLAIETNLRKDPTKRTAIAAGIHGVGRTWIDFFTWLNDTYGKEGDDSVWFPNQEEFYEYNYYRTKSKITKTIQDSVLKITITLPSGLYFYYPSITLNMKGLDKDKVKAVTSNEAVTGLSYANYTNGLMINLDCRKFLVDHAEHYVEKYEQENTKSNLADALYFVSQLKDSQKKEALAARLN